MDHSKVVWCVSPCIGELLSQHPQVGFSGRRINACDFVARPSSQTHRLFAPPAPRIASVVALTNLAG